MFEVNFGFKDCSSQCVLSKWVSLVLIYPISAMMALGVGAFHLVDRRLCRLVSALRSCGHAVLF